MRATITAPAAQIASERRFINMSFSNSIDERIYYISGIILQQEQYCKARQAHSQHGLQQAYTQSQCYCCPALLPPSHAFFCRLANAHPHIAYAHKSRHTEANTRKEQIANASQATKKPAHRRKLLKHNVFL